MVKLDFARKLGINLWKDIWVNRTRMPWKLWSVARRFGVSHNLATFLSARKHKFGRKQPVPTVNSLASSEKWNARSDLLHCSCRSRAPEKRERFPRPWSRDYERTCTSKSGRDWCADEIPLKMDHYANGNRQSQCTAKITQSALMNDYVLDKTMVMRSSDLWQGTNSRLWSNTNVFRSFRSVATSVVGETAILRATQAIITQF